MSKDPVPQGPFGVRAPPTKVEAPPKEVMMSYDAAMTNPPVEQTGRWEDVPY